LNAKNFAASSIEAHPLEPHVHTENVNNAVSIYGAIAATAGSRGESSDNVVIVRNAARVDAESPFQATDSRTESRAIPSKSEGAATPAVLVAQPNPTRFRRRSTDIPSTDEPLNLQLRTELPSAGWVPAPTPNLTQRQTQVLSLLIDGLCNKAISKQLSLSHNTVKSHVAAIFRAMGVNNRTAVVIEMTRKGYKLVRD
jgi:DNA-binding CsgD family transcriptional regulator